MEFLKAILGVGLSETQYHTCSSHPEAKELWAQFSRFASFCWFPWQPSLIVIKAKICHPNNSPFRRQSLCSLGLANQAAEFSTSAMFAPKFHKFYWISKNNKCATDKTRTMKLDFSKQDLLKKQVPRPGRPCLRLIRKMAQFVAFSNLRAVQLHSSHIFIPGLGSL